LSTLMKKTTKRDGVIGTIGGAVVIVHYCLEKLQGKIYGKHKEQINKK